MSGINTRTVFQRMRENAKSGVFVCHFLPAKVLITITQLTRVIVHNCTVGGDDSGVHRIDRLRKAMFEFVTCAEIYLISDSDGA